MHFAQHFFPEIDSTNSAALRAVQHTELAGPTLFYAATQTAGRGTRGRVWQSQTGNVLATYAFPLRPAGGPALPNPHLLVYPIALAIAETVQQVLAAAGSSAKVTLKWPNDVLVNGQKISGALHETAHDGTQTWFLAGIGLNVAWAPPSSETFHPATFVAAHAPKATAKSMLKALTANIEKALTDWPQSNWQTVKNAYLARSHYQNGQELTLSPHGNRTEAITGTFEGLNADGALLLNTPNGPRTFQTADIFPDLPAV